jgi:multiple sugar transport system permease protein
MAQSTPTAAEQVSTGPDLDPDDLRLPQPRDTRTALIMVSPAALGLLLFVIVPFGTAIWLSTQNVALNSLRPPEFFGLEQYRRILVDPETRGEFYRGLINNVTFALVVVPLQTALAVALAVLLNRKLRGMAVYRTFIFMPIVFPMALVAVMWRLIYSGGEAGMLNSAVRTLSLGRIGAIDWLGDPAYAMAAIILLSIWQGVGFQTIIVLAGLQGISTSLYEAAAIDKAGSWRQFLHVTLPGLRNTLIFVVMVTTIFAFRLFDQIYILTPQGGVEDSTTTLMLQAVTSARENNVGRGAAITVVLFVIVLLVTLVQRRVLREDREIA